MIPQQDVPLAPLTTMGVGGPARFFVDATSESEVRGALAWAAARNVRVHLLGGGSNVVIADQGLDGLVVRSRIRRLDLHASHSEVVVSAGAGEAWDEVVEASVKADAAGLECLSGIPGWVGGTPIQNVGAYGQDVSMTIRRVTAVDREHATSVAFSNVDCGFAYRTSRFKREWADRFVVTGVDFALVHGGAPTVSYADLRAWFANRAGRPTLSGVRQAVLAIRRRKGMVIDGDASALRSCGSFFVNPVISRETFAAVRAHAAPLDPPHFAAGADKVKVPAAWLIERAGFVRGWRRGNVGISPLQAQALVNLGGAQAEDVLALAIEIKQAVSNTFGITLVPEPLFLGFPPSSALQWLLDPNVNQFTRADRPGSRTRNLGGAGW